MCEFLATWVKKSAMVWPILPPFIMLAAGFILFPGIMYPGSLTAAPKWEAASILAAESSSRYWTATTLLILAAVCAAAIILSSMVIWRRLGKEEGCKGFVCVGLVAIAALIIVSTLQSTEMYFYLGKDVFDKTIGSFPASGVGLKTLDNMINFGNVISIVAAAFITVAVAALTPVPLPKKGKDESKNRAATDDAIRGLSERVRNLKYLLFAAAIVLFAGLVFMKAWREWPLAYWGTSTSDNNGDTFKGLVTATINFQASHFSLVLAAIFLPMALWLREAGRSLAESDSAIGNDPAAQERWLSSKGVSLALSEQAQRLFAIVSPFLATPLVDNLKSITAPLTQIF